MRLLVIGSGGREHALIWKLAQSSSVEEVYCATGNAGIDVYAHCVPIPPDNIQELADFAENLKMDLTVVGPELPLILGIVDEFQKRGLPVFGPSRRAAELEGSKIFSKLFMERHEIPTGRYAIAESREEAETALEKFGFPVVLKADGLAAGKGVLICNNKEETEQALDLFFEEKKFGGAGTKILVEEFLEGEEASFMVLSDGQRIIPLASAKDYKRVGNDDTGPNTGGMGAHSPAGILDKETSATIMKDVIMPTIRGMADEGREYRGVLYAGLIVTPDGPKVLEYNCRFGDPEIQPVILRMASDLFTICLDGAKGQFNVMRIEWLKEASACVVLASEGYPGAYEKGFVINDIEVAEGLEGTIVFHAGTTLNGDAVTTSGGRVLNVCARGQSLAQAISRCYLACDRIRFDNKYYRKDIGQRVLRKMHYA